MTQVQGNILMLDVQFKSDFRGFHSTQFVLNYVCIEHLICNIIYFQGVNKAQGIENYNYNTIKCLCNMSRIQGLNQIQIHFSIIN